SARIQANCSSTSNLPEQITGTEKQKTSHLARFLFVDPVNSADAEGDACLRQVVWSHFDLDLVAGQDADVVLAHLARNMSRYHVAVVQLDAKHSVGQGLDDRAFHF